MYTSEVAWQPSEVSNSLQFDKKGSLSGKVLIQGHIEVRFEPRFLSSRILFSTACHHKTWKAFTHTHTCRHQNYFDCVFAVLVCARNEQSLLVSLYPYCFVFVPLQSSCLIEQRFHFTTVGFIFRGIPKGASLLRIKCKDIVWGLWKAN